MSLRLTAVLVLAVTVQGYLPNPSNECENMTPMSGVMKAPRGAAVPGACGQPMTAEQCPTGPCAALPQLLVLFAEAPNAPIAIEFIGRFHDRTPPPPEPPPPQA